MTTQYVLGFAFTNNLVILMEKKRPDWQAGKVNGIGGHIEPGETSYEAMVREFMEETGVQTTIHDWNQFATMKGQAGWFVDCFTSKSANYFEKCKTMTDESIWSISRFHLPDNVIPNLHWLVPMAFQNDVKAQIVYH